MCGIFAYAGRPRDPVELQAAFAAIKHRGPDDTQFVVHYRYDDATRPLQPTFMLAFGFHRLAINGSDPGANQPFANDDAVVMCNGEIWNHATLHVRGRNPPRTGSDCECLSGYYRDGTDRPFDRLCRDIDGVFGLVLYDRRSDRLYVGRDRLGIRSLYYALTPTGDLVVASELKSVARVVRAFALNERDVTTVRAFPPGHWAEYDRRRGVCVPVSYWTPRTTTDRRMPSSPDPTCPNAYAAFCQRLHDVVVHAVRKRFMSDRSFGCVLSGGLDSTVVTAVACKLYREVHPEGPPLRTYTVGMAGGTDFEWARKAARYLGTEHHEFVLSEREFLDAIPEVVAQIESYDVTTVRASTGNWLVAKKIAELAKDTVVFCGDVADELLGGYRGFGLTSDPVAFHAEVVRMLSNVHRFDVLRCEKSFAGHGLEGRVPFGDRDLVDLVLGAPVEWCMWGPGGIVTDNGTPRIEKDCLRRAFAGYLPDDVLWRRKEAFSDGVSAETRSWYEVIQEAVGTHPVAETLADVSHVAPYDAESAYYRTLFENTYAGQAEVIPYFWRQPFTDVVDPSARCLANYE